MADAASLEKQLSSNSTILLVYQFGTKNIIVIPSGWCEDAFQKSLTCEVSVHPGQGRLHLQPVTQG